MNNRNVKFDFIKNIFYGVAILAFYFWLISGNSIKEVIDEYLIITKEKVVTTGQITQAKEFENEIESNDSRTVEIINGYSYTYSFLTPNGQKIETQSGNYGKLPLDKNLNDIPYEVEIEYVSNNPEINRIKGVWSNNTELFQWFKQKVFLKLLGLIFCLYLSYKLIKDGINNYQKLKNQNKNYL